MKEIKAISLSGMNKGAHFAFHSEVVKLIEAAPSVTEKVTSQIADYKNAVSAEREVIKIMQKNFRTDDVTKFDKERDALYRGVKNAISAYAAISDEEIQKAYKVLWQLVKEYNIKSTMQIDQATGLLIRFVDDLENKYKAEVKKLALTDFIKRLKEANERLRDAVSQRNAEQTSTDKPKGGIKQVRETCDNLYKTIVKYVNAYALIEGTDSYDSFVNQVNGLIDRYKVQVLKGRSHTSNNKPNESTP